MSPRMWSQSKHLNAYDLDPSLHSYQERNQHPLRVICGVQWSEDDLIWRIEEQNQIKQGKNAEATKLKTDLSKLI